MQTAKKSSVTWSRGERTPALHLGVFGKHPGWDDHIEDLGLDTDRLVRARQKLYTESIAGNIDSGAWEKLDDAQRLPGFGHELVWRVGDEIVVGRLWSSRDGKGRTKYPMAVVAHGSGVPASWIESVVIPRLAEVERACVAAATADEVRAIVDKARADLRAALPTSGSELGGLATPAQLAAMAAAPELGPDRLGLHRVLYEIERELGAFRPAGSDNRRATTRILDAGARHLRVPACAPTTMGTAALWAGLLSVQIDPGADVIVLRPHGKAWADVIVGEPGAAQMFCVKASESGLALATSVPYTLEPAFVARCDAMVAAWQAGRMSPETSDAPAPSASDVPGVPSAPRKRPSWMLWGGAGGAVIVLVGGYFAYQSQRPAPSVSGPIAVNTPAKTATPVPPPSAEVSPELKARQEEARKRLEDEKEGVAKAERERQSREEQTRLAREAADRNAKEAADRAAKDELARKTKEEADREAKDKADREAKEETDRKAREEAERLAKEKEAADLKVKEEAARKVKEDADRAAKEKADRDAKAEADRKAKEASDLKAKEAQSAAERTATLVKRAVDLTAQLNTGLLLTDPAGGAAFIDRARALAGEAEAAGAKEVPEIRSLTERVKGLEAIGASNDTAALLRQVAQAGAGRLAEALSAWSRLASGPGGWPASGADLASGADAVSVLRHAVDAMPDKARSAELSPRVLDQSRAVWTGFFSRLGAADAERINAACATREAYAVDGAALAPRERFNLLAWEFKRDAAALPAGDTDAAKARAGAFAQQVSTLGAPVADRADVKATLAALTAALAPAPVQAPGAVDVRTLGPGARGWKAQPKDAGGRSAVVFAWPADGAARQSLEFVRVDAPSGPVYVCTTEVSIGLLIEAVDAAARWADVLPTLRGFKPGASPDEVKGPRGWSFDTGSGGPAQRIRAGEVGADPGLGWMFVGPRTAGTPYYPDPSRVLPPSPAMPMQYISPVGAAYVAGLLGCRLPTSVEWLAASNLDVGASTNRRDASWRRVVDFLAAKPARVQYDLVWPDAGQCIPVELSGAGSSAFPQGAKAEGAVTSDDGAVWFVPVDQGDGLFKNLVGNVAEYVFEDAAQLDAVKDPAVERFKGIIGKGESVRMIGASALSAREIEPTRPFLPRGADALRGGFSDVGFRLAFSAAGTGAAPVAGGGDVIAAVRRAALESKYLSP